MTKAYERRREYGNEAQFQSNFANGRLKAKGYAACMRHATGDHQTQRAQTVAKTRRCRSMLENVREDALLVRVEPLEWAEEISRRIVDVERLEDGALLLDADPSWAGAIDAVLVKTSVRVSEPRVCLGQSLTGSKHDI
jgi:hypothetical protein